MNEGKIQCKRKTDSAKVIQNLIKILGFPPNELSSILRSAKPIVLVKKLNQVNQRMRRKEQKLCQNLNLETEKNAANKVHFNLKSYKCKICNKLIINN